ncbi:unnamed protein product [Blepharisma stoltei]|uniref:Ankyrin repeat domain-containing protein n=1 Tax=Blepharisma stoltei TaxID=1481888 RepID=A0AAU9INX0_9CILI|nr:unnamed protein product [Blepharisma stoltei]
MGKTQSKPKSLNKEFTQLIMRGDIPKIVELVDKNPYFTQKPLNDNLWNALMLACQSNQLEVVKLLVDGYRVELDETNTDGCTALHICAFQNSRESNWIADYLCRKGADVSKKTDSGVTAKGIAIVNQNKELVTLLAYQEVHGPWATMPWHDRKKLLWVWKRTNFYRALSPNLIKEICLFL